LPDRGKQRVTKKVSDKDYEDIVRFSQKMLQSRVDPSFAFKESLRKRLLQKMVEEEMETERKKKTLRNLRDIFRNIVPRSAAWRVAGVTVTVFVLVLIVAWRLGVFSGLPKPPILGSTLPPTSTVNQGPIKITAGTSKTVYAIGENINLIFTFNNTSNEKQALTSFPPPIMIAASSLRPYRTILGGEPKTLSLGETVECIITWDQLDDEGLQVPAGTYVIEMLGLELSGGNGTITLSNTPQITIIASDTNTR